MKIGVFSDIHGNWPAFKACLKFLEETVDTIYFLGDIFGYMPDGMKILNELIKRDIKIVLGNHDAMVLGLLPVNPQKEKVYQLLNERKKLTPNLRKYLSNLPVFDEIAFDNKRLLFAHGSPWNFLLGYVYENDVNEKFNKLPYDFVFLGHTHIPFVKRLNKTTVINVGSAGLPRDIGNSSCMTIFDTVSNKITQSRLNFDEDYVLELYRGKINESVMNCLKRKKK
jgi:putative phosphoesterase